MRYRILFIPHAYFPVRGGAEYQCQRLAEVTARWGHTVAVVTADVGSVESYYRFGIPTVRCCREQLNGVDVIRIPFGGWLYTVVGAFLSRLPASRWQRRLSAYLMRWIRWRFTQAIGRAIACFGPDVVITLPHLVINVQAVLAIHQRRPFPLVMMPLLHEEDPQWDVSAYQAALAQADAVLANTAHERQRLIEAYGVAPEQVFIGGNGVDLPLAPKQAIRETRVVFLGRKVLGKGLSLLLAAMQQVWQSHPHATLVLAGARGSDTVTIDQRVRALPPQQRERVESLDNISESEKSALLTRARCLVLPSKIESFGVVLLEAWAHGVAVITLDLPVFRELVEPGKDGLLVKADVIRGLASAIRWMLDHPDEAYLMGRNGLEKVATQFSWEQVAERVMAACHYAVSRQHP